MFDHILNWKLLSGPHEFPGPDGGTCINEAAVVAAGFEYRAISNAADMPACFSRVIAEYALTLNDCMPNDQRQMLKPYVLRMAGTADTPDVEHQRATYLAMQAVTVFAAQSLDAAGLPEHAGRCRDATTLAEAARAAWDAAWEARAAWAAWDAAETVAAAAAGAEAETVAAAAAGAAVWAAWAAEAAVWDDALAAFDGVLAIGRQAEPIELPLAIERLERAKAVACAAGGGVIQ